MVNGNSSASLGKQPLGHPQHCWLLTPAWKGAQGLQLCLKELNLLQPCLGRYCKDPKGMKCQVPADPPPSGSAGCRDPSPGGKGFTEGRQSR